VLADSQLSIRYFQEVLFALSSPCFYTKYVYLSSDTTPIPDKILNNPKFYPFFEGALGGIDSPHINCCPTVAEQQSAQN
jgi:hypothetical protein